MSNLNIKRLNQRTRMPNGRFCKYYLQRILNLESDNLYKNIGENKYFKVNLEGTKNRK